jgi:GT2 family glycosyltransferase
MEVMRSFLIYQKWIKKNEKKDNDAIKKEIKKFKYKPKISIITPVYDVDPKWLKKCIESVKKQSYENWELCLYDDASTKKETVLCLKKTEGSDRRIKIAYGKINQHISGASNEALKMATGEFITLLDNDDELSPDALYENVKILNKHRKADFIYSDEDKLTLKGDRVDPFFKPDWSSDLFLSMMYTCHLGVYRKSIVDQIGGFRKGLEGSQDYDLVLRFIEKTDPKRIFHIPKILYHWRKIPGSTAHNQDSKGYAYIAAKQALADHLKHSNIQGRVLTETWRGIYRVKRDIQNSPKVSIIIPFKDQVSALKKCVESVIKKTTYQNYEIILVNNRSQKKETLDYIKKQQGKKKIRLLSYNKPFNFSAINNFAASRAKGEYVLFLNNDTEVISKQWLESMLEHIQRKEVGAVGAKLLYKNRTIQHAGIIMGLGIASHAFRNVEEKNPGYFGLASVIRNYCAVTGACLMTKKDLFNKIGGFDEKHLAIAYNDVDFCLRLKERGFFVVYTPHAKLLHHESLSRNNESGIKSAEKRRRMRAEEKYMARKWKKYIENDPYYSPNLTRKSGDFGINILD